MKKYPNYSVCARIPHSLLVKLNQRRKARQSLAGVVEEILRELEDIEERRDPLIDKIIKLQNDLDYFEQQDITPKLLEQLEKRRHPYQSLGGVIQELIDTAEKVRMGDFRIYEKPSGEG